ncbi:hypothetical protein Tco_1074477 [Tanacetum coccineum]
MGPFIPLQNLNFWALSSSIQLVEPPLPVWLSKQYVGPRVNVPRSLRWAGTGAITVSASTALLVRLFSPECEPQNIEAYDKKK